MMKGKVRIIGNGVLGIFCPACKSYHAMNVYNNETPSWTFNGDYDRPTFNPSLLLRVEKKNKPDYICHSFVRNGKIEYLSDCTHKLASQTIDTLDEESIKLVIKEFSEQI